MKKRYLIYYITTGSYNYYANTFFNSIHNFMPGDEKCVIWICDKFNAILQTFMDVDPENITIKTVTIPDMPWPLITLQKMHFCLNTKFTGYDGYFYFNADSDITKMTDTCINDIKEALDNNKVICSWHGRSYVNVRDIIEGNTNNYKNAGFFGGNENIFYSLCSDVVDRINNYLLNNKIPEWHDETVLNEVLSTGKYQLFYKPFLVLARFIRDFDDVFKSLQNISPYLFITMQKDMKYRSHKLKY